jgi:hypothetical protein
MGNILSALGGAAEGAVLGGGGGAIAGGLSGLLGGGGGSMTGSIGNSELQAAMGASEQDQVNNEIDQMAFDSRLQWQNTMFGQMLEQKSESMKQVNQLREVAMQQRKADDSITKEYIQAIKS